MKTKTLEQLMAEPPVFWKNTTMERVMEECSPPYMEGEYGDTSPQDTWKDRHVILAAIEDTHQGSQYYGVVFYLNKTDGNLYVMYAETCSCCLGNIYEESTETPEDVRSGNHYITSIDEVVNKIIANNNNPDRVYPVWGDSDIDKAILNHFTI